MINFQRIIRSASKDKNVLHKFGRKLKEELVFGMIKVDYFIVLCYVMILIIVCYILFRESDMVLFNKHHKKENCKDVYLFASSYKT